MTSVRERVLDIPRPGKLDTRSLLASLCTGPPTHFSRRYTMPVDGSGGGDGGGGHAAREFTWKEWIARAEAGDATAMHTVARWHVDRQSAAAAGVQPPFVPKVCRMRSVRWLAFTHLAREIGQLIRLPRAVFAQHPFGRRARKCYHQAWPSLTMHCYTSILPLTPIEMHFA